MKILFISLGCDKNLVDSEVMLGSLSEAGFEITNDENEADVAIVNTCSFIHDAKQESVNAILEMSELKKSGQLKVLLVCGCLAQRYADELKKEIPEIDGILGTQALKDIVKAVKDALKGKEDILLPSIDGKLYASHKRMVTTGGYYAYLKIAEGCDKCCTYCAIPSMRGKYRSFEMDFLVEEAEKLVEEVGVKEIILVAQESTLYGVDLYGHKALPELLHRLCAIEGLEWVRILYCYPEEITEELLLAMKEEPKVCHYLDIPIQHASDGILKRMGRRTDNKELKDKIKLIRKILPDVCLRTTLITGFPGETEEDVEILKDFVKKMKFDRLGVFTYSKEEGTPAAKMKGQVAKKLKEKRRDEIMLLQQEIAFAKAKKRKGEILTVMVEGYIPEEEVYVARSYMDAPDVDGFVFFTAECGLLSGDMVKVKITGSNEYDLIGVLCDEFSE